MVNFYSNPFNVPIGGGMLFLGTSAPSSNFSMPSGQAISRTTFSTLFGICGTAYGPGDGSTTFNLPDLRSRVPYGWDSMGGTPSGRIGTVVTDGGTIVGTTVGSTGGSATHAMTINEMPTHDHGALTGTGHASISFTAGSVGTGQITFNAPSGPATALTNPSALSISDSGHTHSIPGQGGGVGMSILAPGIIIPWVIRII